MRRWWTDLLAAAGQVADRPALWLPGALAWTVSFGWLSLAVGVARPAGLAQLTFLGAGIFNSGAWPWNAIGIGLGALAAAIAAFALAATGEAVLLRGWRSTWRDVIRVFVLALVCAVPALVALAALGVATVGIAPREFNRPDQSLGPVIRTALAVGPFILATVLAAAVGASLHAAAARHAAARREPVVVALAAGARTLARAGAPVIAQAVTLLVARVAYLALSALLLRVLWAPIGAGLDAGAIDPALALLLVGFVAIWLCLVLGGGALHAWGSLAWTRLLRVPVAGRRGGGERMETGIGS